MKKNRRLAGILTALIMITGCLSANAEDALEDETDSEISSYRAQATENNGHAYLIVEKQISWDEAEAVAEQAGGHLATVTSQEEQTFLENLNTNNTRVWIGGYRDDDYVWYWVTEETWDYTCWKSGEPNNSSNVISNETKVAMWPLNWNDLNTESREQKGFIIEWDDDVDDLEETETLAEQETGNAGDQSTADEVEELKKEIERLKSVLRENEIEYD